MEYVINKNQQFNSLEITFEGKPSAEVRNALKALKFRWHGQKKVWYGFAEEDAVLTAIRSAGAEEPEELIIPEPEKVDEGTLYEGWCGGNNYKWRTDKELKALLSADFKKAKVPASIRFGRGSYITSLTVTIRIHRDDILSFAEYKDKNPLKPESSYYYRAPDGMTKCIDLESLDNMEGAEHADMVDRIQRLKYDGAVYNLQRSSGVCVTDRVLSGRASKLLDKAQAIVDSYNRDCSNAMIDYFDRSIYDNYAFKIVD